MAPPAKHRPLGHDVPKPWGTAPKAPGTHAHAQTCTVHARTPRPAVQACVPLVRPRHTHARPHPTLDLGSPTGGRMPCAAQKCWQWDRTRRPTKCRYTQRFARERGPVWAHHTRTWTQSHAGVRACVGAGTLAHRAGAWPHTAHPHPNLADPSYDAALARPLQSRCYVAPSTATATIGYKGLVSGRTVGRG